LRHLEITSRHLVITSAEVRIVCRNTTNLSPPKKGAHSGVGAEDAWDTDANH